MTAVVTAEAFVDGSGHRVGLTLTGLGVGTSTLTVWRSYDDERDAVAGQRRVTANDAGYIVDHHAPVGRPVSYEIEILTGPNGAQRLYSNDVNLDTGGLGVLSDPLVPQSWVSLAGTREDKDSIYLRSPALEAIEQQSDVSLFKIMGSRKPMALFGQRMAESGVDTSVGTRSLQENANLNKMLNNTSYLLFRPHPSWGSGLPGVMFISNPAFTRVNVTTLMGGDLTWFNLKSDVVGAPTMKVLTAVFTWGDVAIMFETWGQYMAAIQASASAAGESPTWLYNVKHPLG